MMAFYYAIMVSFNRIFNLLYAFIVVKGVPPARGIKSFLGSDAGRNISSVALNFPGYDSLAWFKALLMAFRAGPSTCRSVWLVEDRAL
jgi:hypothetical protein